MTIVSNAQRMFKTYTDTSEPVTPPKKISRTKKLIISHTVVLAVGVGIANTSAANHPEWVMCCATLPKSVIAKNIADAKAEAKARLDSINRVAETNK